jgi:hypothetical protein
MSRESIKANWATAKELLFFVWRGKELVDDADHRAPPSHEWPHNLPRKSAIVPFIYALF